MGEQFNVSEVAIVSTYLMARTPNRTSIELVDAIQRTWERGFIAGSAVYGWYDVFIESDLPRPAALTTMLQELLHARPNVPPLETAEKRTASHSRIAPFLAS